MKKLIAWIIVASAFIICLISIARIINFLSSFTLT